MRASPERLVKLGASPAFHLPDLSGLADGASPGPERESRVETTYFDTADLRLARWGLGLHHDGPGGDWRLDLPAGRGELAFPGSARRPPQAALALVRAYLRGAPVVPVARLSTWCRRVPLLDGDGRRLAEVAEDEVSVLQGRRVAARFREVEVEVEPGAEAVLGPLLDRLRQAGAIRSDPVARHMRALGPAAEGEPDVAVRALPDGAAAGDVVRNAFAAAVGLVLRHDPLVRLGGDPEAVHQARVGTRRMRSHLRTFRPLLDHAWNEELRAELGWLGGELGAVRDREVLLDRLRALSAHLPAADLRPSAALIGELTAGVEQARGRLQEAMGSQRYFDLLDRLVLAAAEPLLTGAAAQPADRVLPALVRRPWRDLRRAVRALPAQPPDGDLHRVRILAKRVRYAAEAAAPVVGAEAAAFARLAAGLQDVLGEHQDSVTAQAWLRGAAGSGRRAFVAGELCAMEAARAAGSRRRWPKAWAGLRRRRTRAWLRRVPPLERTPRSEPRDAGGTRPRDGR